MLLYDALLDELDDDATSRADDAIDELAEDAVLGFRRCRRRPDSRRSRYGGRVGRLDLDVNVDGLLDGVEDDESWSDDPVRMYLTQMGEIPLLIRQQEVTLARQIEDTRAKFRRHVLECDYVMQLAVKVLRRVHDGELPFDRTVQVSVTDQLEKYQILGRLPSNLRTLETLLKRNQHDYNLATSRSRPPAQRRAAWRRLGRRRRRAVRLIEELGLRTQRIEPMIKTLDEFSRRVDELKGRIDEHRKTKGRPHLREPWLTEFRNILRGTQESPTSLRNRVQLPQGDLRPLSRGQARACRKATCGWSSPSPRSTATAA